MTDKCTNDGCGVSLGRYLYTDGREVELCPWCDREHADELRPIVEPTDEKAIGHAAHWLHSAIYRAHGRALDLSDVVGSDVLYSAQAASRAELYAGDVHVRNSAVRALRTRLVDAVRDYTHDVLHARLRAMLDGARRTGYADGLAETSPARKRGRPRKVNMSP